MMKQAELIAKGLIGTITPLLGAVASWQEHMEWGLRVLSLVIGIVVGAATLVSISRNRSRKE